MKRYIDNLNKMYDVINDTVDGKQTVLIPCRNGVFDKMTETGHFIRGEYCNIVLLADSAFKDRKDMLKFFTNNAANILTKKLDLNTNNPSYLEELKTLDLRNIEPKVYISFLRLFGMGKEESIRFFKERIAEKRCEEILCEQM